MMDEDVRTIWCGNLSEKVSEDILYELFIQGGPVQKVSIPKDRDGKQKNFGFVTYKHELSVPYALDLFDGTSLFNRTLNMKSRNNSLDTNQYNNQYNNQYQQQQQQQQYQPQLYQHSSAEFDQVQLLQQQSQLRQQIAFAQNSMYMMPGGVAYPSQNSSYMQNPSNSRNSSNSSSRNSGSNSRYHNRSHPYKDHHQYNDRHDKRQDSYNRSSRDQKSYKQSSHRSNRHDNKRKYH